MSETRIEWGVRYHYPNGQTHVSKESGEDSARSWVSPSNLGLDLVAKGLTADVVKRAVHYDDWETSDE